VRSFVRVIPDRDEEADMLALRFQAIKIKSIKNKAASEALL
jgi:hypothetical protein